MTARRGRRRRLPVDAQPGQERVPGRRGLVDDRVAGVAVVVDSRGGHEHGRALRRRLDRRARAARFVSMRLLRSTSLRRGVHHGPPIEAPARLTTASAPSTSPRATRPSRRRAPGPGPRGGRRRPPRARRRRASRRGRGRHSPSRRRSRPSRRHRAAVRGWSLAADRSTKAFAQTAVNRFRQTGSPSSPARGAGARRTSRSRARCSTPADSPSRARSRARRRRRPSRRAGIRRRTRPRGRRGCRSRPCRARSCRPSTTGPRPS